MSLRLSPASRLDGETLLRILRQVEAFEDCWKRDSPEALEKLVSSSLGAEFDELFRQGLGIELDYRRGRGERPTLEEYLARFPEAAAAVREVFEGPGGSPDPARSCEAAPEPPAMIGKFVVLARLGGGGQASAYLARDPDLGRLVVLKRFYSAADGSQAAGAMLDGQALARVRSRYVPLCFGLERVGPELVLVMEYVAGRNLSEAFKRKRPRPREAAFLVEKVAEGLDAIHACGLIHRDIKPANIVLGDDRAPRLVDFGLAAHLGSTALQAVSGTPPYMAPEQARGQWERIDFRTDVYGLGAVLYKLLAGRPPHPGATLAEALEHAQRGEVTPPREVNRSIPRGLEAIVMRALAADPVRRYSTAKELHQALRRHRLQPVRRAAAAAAGMLLLTALAMGYIRAVDPNPSTRTVASPAPSPAPPSPAALTGDLTVRVWTPGGQGKRGWSVDDARALPVLEGEQVHLEARLNQPAYAYLLWLDGRGRASSLYPWLDRGFGLRPPDEPVREAVQSPTSVDEGWPMQGPSGLETALLLARRTPLPAEIDLAALIGRLPPAPLRDAREVVERGFDPGQAITAIHRGAHRGLGEEAVEIDDPLLRLMARLKPHFEMIRVTRFAYQGGSDGAR